MPRLVAILVLMLMAGCAAPSNVDGVVKIKWHKTEQAWVKVRELTGRKDPLIKGHAYFDGEVCHVIAPDMKASDRELYILGHEVKHCFDGAFH